MENKTEGEENNNKNSNINNIIDNNNSNSNSNNKNNEKMNGEERWGTWEELLLACAVKRHGLKNWESVSMEIQNKTSLSLLSTTPQICHQKYLDLKRRFTSTTSSASSSSSSSSEEDDDAKRQEDEEEDKIEIDRIPWLDELRKLRVAELKQEVQKYDVSILSLQLKVKELKEERERSLKDSQDNGDVEPDLEGKSKDISEDGVHVTPDKSPDEKLVAIVGEDESENLSFNESNTTESKCENRGGGEIGGSDEPVETEREPVEEETGQKKPDPETSESTKPVSYNESSDSVLKKTEAEEEEEMKGTTVVGGGGEEATTKESSDVQSSASLTGRKRRRKRREDVETEEASPATTKRNCAKSQPLIEFLEMIRSHKHGSWFEIRLHSQETEEYKNIVRQHVDLKTVQKRLEEGKYSSGARRFYRDLLLLVSNAIVFYPKSKPEYEAAHELRELVSNQMKDTSRRPESSSAEPAQASSNSKPGSDRFDSILAKQKSSSPIVVCRKRSSLSAKPASSAGLDKNADKKVDEKPAAADQKALSKLSAVVSEDAKPKGKDNRPATWARSSRKNNKNRRNNAPNKIQSANISSEPSMREKGETNKKDKNATTKDKENNSSDNASTLAKKRGAADFLKRIKRNSPNKGGSAADTPKSGGNESNNGGRGADQKKKQNVKGDNTTSGRRDPILQRTRGVGKLANEENSPSKRNVGRPPKKGAQTISSKRSREVEPEVVTTKQPPRKRTKR